MKLQILFVMLFCVALIVEGGKKNKGNRDRDRGGKKGNKNRDRPRPVTTTTVRPAAQTPPPVNQPGRLLKEDLRRHLSQQNGPLPPAGSVRTQGGQIALGLNIGEGTPNRLSEEEKRIFLDAHNQFRSEAQPYAAIMVKLQWDEALASMAQGWADRCTFSHGNPENISPFSYVGQNLWAGSGPLSYWNHYDMIKSWNDEKEYYDYNSNSCSSVCGHYTQIVWAETTHVGCALASCSTLHNVGWSPASILVCNYGEGGNYVGEKPYISGYPCSQCPSGHGTCVQTQLCSAGPAEPDDREPHEPPPESPGSGPGDNPDSPSCGSTMKARSDEAVLESPNYPLPYDNDLMCEWTIRGKQGRRMSIEFLFMSIEESTQCIWDYLAIDAEDGNMYRYCGTTPPATIVSSAERVHVQLRSDGSVTGGGFKLRYRLVNDEPEQDAHGGVVTGSKGTIRSPGYPQNYPNNLDVVWVIRVAENKRVRLIIKSIDIEYHSMCHYDALSIKLGTEVVPMSLCGSEHLAGKAYFSLANDMEIRFSSDTRGSAGGFDLRWKAV